MITKIKKSLGFGDGSEKKFYAKAGKDIQYQTSNISHKCCDAYQNIDGSFFDWKVDWCVQNAFILYQIKTWYRSVWNAVTCLRSVFSSLWNVSIFLKPFIQKRAFALGHNEEE